MMKTMEVKQIVQQMMSAGVHFGHKTKNPKMLPYIYKEKDDLQIIDLFQTYKYLRTASQFLFNASQSGKKVLFVGTKKHIAKCIEQTAIDCDSWYINKRWLGGFLTNFNTVKNSLSTSLTITKKERAHLERRQKRIQKYLGGVQTMSKLPDIVIILGQNKEINAVKECNKLKIPSVTILDTDCDPSLTDFLIPANDDSLTSVNFILNKLSKAIKEGKKHVK